MYGFSFTFLILYITAWSVAKKTCSSRFLSFHFSFEHTYFSRHFSSLSLAILSVCSYISHYYNDHLISEATAQADRYSPFFSHIFIYVCNKTKESKSIAVATVFLPSKQNDSPIAYVWADRKNTSHTCARMFHNRSLRDKMKHVRKFCLRVHESSNVCWSLNVTKCVVCVEFSRRMDVFLFENTAYFDLFFYREPLQDNLWLTRNQIFW